MSRSGHNQINPNANGGALDPSEAAECTPATVFREGGELLAEFFNETSQHLDQADHLLLVLERSPGDKQAVDALYRAFHSVKGLSAFFGLKPMNVLAHRAEDLLGLVRDGHLQMSGKTADLAFAALDGLKRQADLAREAAAVRKSVRIDPKLRRLLIAFEQYLRNPSDPGFAVPGHTVEGLPNTLNAKIDQVGNATVTPERNAEESEPELPSPPAVTPTAGSMAAAGSGCRPADRTDKESIRIDCDKLDQLINTIGELVISSSMISQLLARQDPFSAEVQSFAQLNKVVRGLQEMSLGLRLMPVAATFQKMARIVRDVAKKLGKQVQFVIEGEDTELDKSVVDHIGDPLMHMVRNSVDHGIETPEVRAAAGKPPAGTVRLRAFYQGGNVHLELSDDGKGLDRAAILRKATERGLIAEGATLSDAEVYALIFEPGFSLATKVTDVSGRGVGMDVVRRNVEALQGSVAVRSEVGRSTTITIRLPLTLAILDGLMVGVGDVVYVVPLLAVVESLRPQRHELKRVGTRTEVVIVRGETVPLIRLHRLFRTPARVTDPASPVVVIVEDQGRKCALLVDSLIGQSQVVIKTLETNYRKVDGVAGATILGDGDIALILDVFGLIRLAGTLPDDPAEPAWSTP